MSQNKSTMSKLGFTEMILFGLVTSMMVLVECQTACTTKDDCPETGCCYKSSCRNSGICSFFDALCKRYSGRSCSCSVNSDCTTGCCVNSRCKQSYSYECIYKETEKETCYLNSQCSSGCCKDLECKATSEACADDKDDPTVYFPTFQLPTFPYYAWTTHNSVEDYDDYYNNDEGGGSSSSSNGSTGRTVGYTFAIVILAFLKVVFWVMWCSRRRRRVVVVRRTACVGREVNVAIVQHDHLQREHERLQEGTQDIPEGPPPAYSPVPGSDNYEDATRGLTETDQDNGLVTTSGGVPQGIPMGPPPEYSPSTALDSGENTTQNAGQNPPQALLTPSAASEGTHGVPQGTPSNPPPRYSQ